ncbi:unnamed protein product [Meloidogyne enterolobii]|uniref:Uncharacterized protein n=1 Tax=Meloidogyne enterolobii TaxID=390850 RepID=A0ACB0ZAU5_MELEN
MNLTFAFYFFLLMFEVSFENGINEQVVIETLKNFEVNILRQMETKGEDNIIFKYMFIVNNGAFGA